MLKHRFQYYYVLVYIYEQINNQQSTRESIDSGDFKLEAISNFYHDKYLDASSRIRLYVSPGERGVNSVASNPRK